MNDPRRPPVSAGTPPPGFVPFPRSAIEQSIPDRFAAMVAAHAGRVAVKTAAHTLSYAELDAGANRVAHAVLARCGRGAEPVALLFEHGAPVVIALLGVLKAGKFYVPLDPGLPPPRLADLLSDLGTRLVLTDAAHLGLARAAGSDGVHVVDVDALPGGLPTTDPGVPTAPGDVAYIVYTSGSTGLPKGAVVDHRVVLHYTMNYTNAVHYTAADRISQINALTSNAAGSEIFPALLNGAAVFPRSIRQEGAETLGAWLGQEAITSYGSVPSVFRAFAAALPPGTALPALRVLRLGGDQLLRSDVELFKRRFAPGGILRNGYGSAEVLLVRNYFIDAGTELATHVVPVGYALEDVEVLILDEDGRPLGADQVGEIAVKSRYLARGYWRRPELTAARFLPVAGGGEERIYRTGDLGRMQPDGCLIHLGRKDFLVKIRGKLVAPIEVENTLLELPSIQEAVVVAKDGQGGEARLVAYYVAGAPPGPPVSAIRQALAERLPAELVPSAFVALPAMPLTANRKIDRLALPEPPRTRPDLGAPPVGPRTPVEEALRAIWSDVLGIGEIGIRDPFLDLGGDSLLAAKVAARVLDRFAVKVTPDALVHCPTIEALAPFVVERLLEPEGAAGSGPAAASP